MGNFFRRNKLQVLLCIAAILVGAMLYSVTRGGNTASTSGFQRLLTPIRSFSNTVAYQIEHLAKPLLYTAEYQQEVEALRAENAELKNRLLDYEDTKNDLAELEKFMGIKVENPDYLLSDPCNIISYVTNDPFHSFWIDKGSEDGIKVQDPVVTAEGVVGIIAEVSDSSALVQTLFSPRLSIGAMAATAPDTGIVEGEVSLARNYKCRMIYLDRDSDLQKGDLIETSGSSELFPQGYLIGTVQEMKIMDSGLSRYAVIQPAVDFENLTSVIVILSYDSTSQAEPAGEEQDNG